MCNAKNIYRLFLKGTLIVLLLSSHANSSIVNSIPKNTSSISIPWNIPVAMSVFQRNHFVFVVFDKYKAINIKELKNSTLSFVHDIIQIPHNSATILRLTIEDNIYVSVRKEGLLWIVELNNNRSAENKEELRILTKNNPVSLFISGDDIGNNITFTDPEVGDIIVAIPLGEQKPGTINPYIFPDLTLLKSPQGLGFIPNVDDISIAKSNNITIIEAKNRDLNITQDLELLKRREDSTKNPDNISSLKRDVPINLLSRNFNDIVLSLEQNIKSASSAQKNEAMLELARYYTGKDLATNALAILETLEKQGAPETKFEKFHGISGVANFLARRYQKAFSHFTYGKLPESEEAILWQNIIISADHPDNSNNDVLKSNLPLIKSYPTKIRDKIAIIGAKTAIAVADETTAQNFIDILKTSEDAEIHQAPIFYLSGRKFEIQELNSQAIFEYRKAVKLNDNMYSPLSELKIAKIDKNFNFIPRLEMLKYEWNNPKFNDELDNLLSNLYIQEKEYANAVRSLDNTSEQSRLALIENIFLQNSASSFDLVTIFNENSALIKKSPYYNIIIEKVADSMVALNLIPEAVGLLKEQKNSKTKLALIYLMEEENSKVLKLLEHDTSEFSQILKAKALANIGKNDEALTILQDNNSHQAHALRSEIFWNAGLWVEAAHEINFLIKSPTPDKPLSVKQTNLIINRLTALKKAGLESEIASMKKTFAPYLSSNNTFNVLTQRFNPNKIEIYDIEQTIKNLKSFVANNE